VTASERVQELAVYLDRIDPQWVFEIDLADPQPVLEQLHLGWVDGDHADTLEASGLAATEAGVFAPWSESAWREAVGQRQDESDEERVIRLGLP
jgi:hypothetical protein